MDISKISKKLMNKKIIIWDFDGTIVSLNIDWKKLKNELLEFVDEELKDYSLNSIVYWLIKDDKKNLAFDIINKYENTCTYILNDEVINFIKNNNNTYKMFIFSDNNKLIITKILKKFSLVDFFYLIVSKEDVEFYKPHPEGLNIIYKYVKEEDKSKYLYIGDSVKDQIASNNFNIDFYKIK